MEGAAAAVGRPSRHHRLQKDMLARLGDESEDGGQRPGQDARLPARKLRQRLAPLVESLFERAAAVQQLVKRPGEPGGAGATLHGIAQRHLFEGEQEVGARFDADGSPRDFQRIAVQQLPEHGLGQLLLPLQMGLPLVVALPRQIVGVAKACPEIAAKLAPATRERSVRRPWRALGACAAWTAFGFGTLQVRVLAARQCGFVALAEPARGLWLGQPLSRAAGVQPFDLSRCCGTRRLLFRHDRPTARGGSGCGHGRPDGGFKDRCEAGSSYEIRQLILVGSPHAAGGVPSLERCFPVPLQPAVWRTGPRWCCFPARAFGVCFSAEPFGRVARCGGGANP